MWNWIVSNVPLRYKRDFRLRCDPAVVKEDERKKLCLSAQKFFDNCKL